MAKEKNLLDIIRGISQAASAAYDGTDSEGERIKAGLKREEGDFITDKRIMDGFGVAFYGDHLCIKYHGEVSMKDVHSNGPKKFEKEIETQFNEIAKFLKKEYKKVTGETLKLTPLGDADSLIQRMSSIRNWVQSRKHYKIGGLTGVDSVDPEEERSVDKNIRDFLSLSSKNNPKNVTRKND